jgi:formylglycine-generating enzyme required for sulfatase activity
MHWTEVLDRAALSRLLALGQDAGMSLTPVTFSPSADPKSLVVRKSETSMHPVEQASWDDALEFCKKL